MSQPGSKTGRFLVQADGCHCEGVHVSGTRWSNFHAMRPQALQRGGGMAEAQRQGGRWKIRDRQKSRKGAVNKLFPLTANTPCTASGNFQAPAPTLCMFTRRRCQPRKRWCQHFDSKFLACHAESQLANSMESSDRRQMRSTTGRAREARTINTHNAAQEGQLRSSIAALNVKRQMNLDPTQSESAKSRAHVRSPAAAPRKGQGGWSRCELVSARDRGSKK